MKISLTAALLVAAFPIVVQAQTRVEANTRASVRAEARQSDGETRGGSAVDAQLSATARAELPTEPVAAAMAEARARGASEARAARIGVATHARLVVSRQALDAGRERAPSHAETSAGAEALAEGASRSQLTALARAAAEDRSLVASLETLARVGSNAGFAETTAALRTQLARGASDQAINALD